MDYVFVFLMMMMTDMFWAIYLRRAAQGKPFMAASMASILLLLGGYVVIAYTEDRMMLIPAALGAFVGTYITVWWDKEKK